MKLLSCFTDRRIEEWEKRTSCRFPREEWEKFLNIPAIKNRVYPSNDAYIESVYGRFIFLSESWCYSPAPVILFVKEFGFSSIHDFENHYIGSTATLNNGDLEYYMKSSDHFTRYYSEDWEDDEHVYDENAYIYNIDGISGNGDGDWYDVREDLDDY